MMRFLRGLFPSPALPRHHCGDDTLFLVPTGLPLFSSLSAPWKTHFIFPNHWEVSLAAHRKVAVKDWPFAVGDDGGGVVSPLWLIAIPAALYFL